MANLSFLVFLGKSINLILLQKVLTQIYSGIDKILIFLQEFSTSDRTTTYHRSWIGEIYQVVRQWGGVLQVVFLCFNLQNDTNSVCSHRPHKQGAINTSLLNRNSLRVKSCHSKTVELLTQCIVGTFLSVQSGM